MLLFLSLYLFLITLWWFSFSSFNPCRRPHLVKTESICFKPDPSWILFFPEHQRTASVQWSLYSHWATASLSFAPPYFPLFCSTLAPFISFLCDCFPPSQAPIISVHSSLGHPLLFSEPEAHSPSQAVSPHLCPLSSHQYPSTSPSSRKQSDPSVCCHPSASRLNAISLTPPLLWVNMTHASIILLSFCHYYAPWTSLHLSLLPFSALLHSVSISHPSVRLTLLISSLRRWQILLSVFRHFSGMPPILPTSWILCAVSISPWRWDGCACVRPFFLCCRFA